MICTYVFTQLTNKPARLIITQVRKFSLSGILGNEVVTLPKLKVRWFYATDIPKSKPDWVSYTKEKEPEKFIPFSDYDSKRLEKSYNDVYIKNNSEESSSLVDVNEDQLFQVDLKKFELSPIYWEGPIYEVRRGTWFYTNGIPVQYKISEKLEEGYKITESFRVNKSDKKVLLSKENLAKFNKESNDSNLGNPKDFDMGNETDIVNLQNGQVAMYFDKEHAAIFPSSMTNKFQLGVIRNFGPTSASLVSVERIQRGYSDNLDHSIFDRISTNPIPAVADTFKIEIGDLLSVSGDKKTSVQSTKVDKTEQNKSFQTQLEKDYDLDVTPDSSNREIDHLVLCVHGIGQILGVKYESVNFTHSINVLRNTMRSVYEEDDRYSKLAYEPDSENKQIKSNNRIQVLPISWRHKIDFHPKKHFESYDSNGNYRLPTLSQINIDGVKSLRNLFGDVVLDVLLYYEQRYVNQIFKVVTEELNRVYNLYVEKNPNFKGKVHIMGHSLGSAIVFDILSSQKNEMERDGDPCSSLSFEVENLYCVGSPVGVFKLLEQVNIRPRSSLSSNYDPKGKSNIISAPRCRNLYNVFHPCDPVAYRMEPLIAPNFSNFKPEAVPFAVHGINAQFEELANIGDEITEKIMKASKWFRSQNKKDDSTNLSIDEKLSKENALGDIISTLASSEKDKKVSSKNKKVEIPGNDLKLLTQINRTGRVDYCLPMGVFDITLLSAISAHVSYFEDKDTAGFIMQQTLQCQENTIDKKTVSIYN